MKIVESIFVRILFTFCLMASFQEAFGYTVITLVNSNPSCRRDARWKTNSVPMYRDSNSFPDGSAQTNALINSWSRWNNGASNVVFSTTKKTGVGLNNNMSEIWFSSDQTILSGNPSVVMPRFSPDCYVREADIIFGTQPNVTSQYWSFTENGAHLPYQPFNSASYRSFQGNAIHELGHALGLDHTPDRYSIMGSEFTHLTRNGSGTFYDPGEDGNSGAAWLYGLASNRPDIGVSVMKFTYASGVYSQHDFGVIYRPGGAPAFTCPSPNQYNQQQPCFTVNRGQNFQLEVTVENNGTSSGAPANIPLKIYLCTDRSLSTGTLITSWNISHPRTSYPLSATLNFNIPTSAAASTYRYLAVFYVPESGQADTFSGNNVAYFPVFVI